MATTQHRSLGDKEAAVKQRTPRDKQGRSSTASAPPPAAHPSAARRHRPLLWTAGLIVIVGAIGIAWSLAAADAPVVYNFRVVNSFPHDPNAYCQGLVIDDGILYEGTGKNGESTLRQVDLKTGAVQRAISLDRRYFGEGITVWKDKIIQLTWRSKTAFVYDKRTFQEIERFRISGEGWGLTHDGTHLIMSDGSASLRFLDPDTYEVRRRVIVTNRGRRLDKLNELEFVDGEIFANIWYEDVIARISPQTGEVVGWIDLRGLMPGRTDREAVLNGIAYDAQADRLFVTGKNWPRLFEIEVFPRR